MSVFQKILDRQRNAANNLKKQDTSASVDGPFVQGETPTSANILRLSRKPEVAEKVEVAPHVKRDVPDRTLPPPPPHPPPRKFLTYQRYRVAAAAEAAMTTRKRHPRRSTSASFSSTVPSLAVPLRTAESLTASLTAQRRKTAKNAVPKRPSAARHVS